jgi:Domain of unknown function (DUF4191)
MAVNPKKRSAATQGGRDKQSTAEKPPSRNAQIREAFKITRRRDRRLIPMMALWGLGTFAAFEIVGWLVNDLIVFSVFAVVSGLLVAFIVFGRRAQASAYGEIEGQPGAAAAVIDTLRGDWRMTPNVAATKTFEVVHRVVGRPGVVLVGEGDPGRLQPLIADQQKRISRVASGTPITVLIVGNGPGQVPLRKLQQRMNRLPRSFKGATVDQIEGRLRALGSFNAALPKGPLPKGARLPKGMRLPR